MEEFNPFKFIGIIMTHVERALVLVMLLGVFFAHQVWVDELQGMRRDVQAVRIMVFGNPAEKTDRVIETASGMYRVTDFKYRAAQ